MTDKTTNCSNVITLTDKFGWINSPNYPEKYENNTECLWLIKPLRNNFIQLNIHHFQLEKGIKSYKVKINMLNDAFNKPLYRILQSILAID